MPLYMDIHHLEEGTTPEDVAKAHAKDMETEKKYGVEYTKYWVNESGKKSFVLLTHQMPKRQCKYTVKPTA
jgi:Protein of unknown function (DUF4242)